MVVVEVSNKSAYSSSVWVQIIKMSSMKRHYLRGWCRACVSASVLNLATNRLAYDEALRVPMAVPVFGCRRCS